MSRDQDKVRNCAMGISGGNSLIGRKTVSAEDRGRSIAQRILRIARRPVWLKRNEQNKR